MRRNVLTIYAVLLSISLSAQVGINTINPDPSSVLDIQSPDKGILLPRVNLENLTQHISGTTNAVGLLIYHIGSTTIPKGFYAWDGDSWIQFVDESKLKKSMYWAPQGVSTSNKNTPSNKSTNDNLEIDIFQKGKVAIGYSDANGIQFDVNTSQKKLEVGGDFRTSYLHENPSDPSENMYFGFETNSIALPSQFATRANVLFNAKTKDLGDYSRYSKPYDGSILIQSKDKLLFLSRMGNTTTSQYTTSFESQLSSNGRIDFVIKNDNANNTTEFLNAFTLDRFSVDDRSHREVQFGLDFNAKKFYIGNLGTAVDADDDNPSTRYFFPNAKGADGQVLKLNATTSSLEWANESGGTGTNNAQKFFYMPSIVIDTKAVKQGVKRNLYAEYVAQFSNKKFEMDETGGKIVDEARTTFVKSTNAPNVIPYLPNSKDLYYYVTDYDTTALENLFIDENGILTYDVKGAGTDYSFINIVFVIK